MTIINLQMYNTLSNSFPTNQAVPQPLQRAFTSRKTYGFLPNEKHHKSHKTHCYDRTKAGVLPSVRGLVYAKGHQCTSYTMSVVQKPALDDPEAIQTKKRKNTIQGELIQFHQNIGVRNVDGWIKLHRQIEDNFLWIKPFPPIQAWLYLLHRAAYEEREVLHNGHLVQISRGELVSSVRKLALDWGWSKSKVGRFMDVLKTGTMIGTRGNQSCSIISICNYEKYQNIGTQNGTVAGQSRDSRGTVAGHPSIMNKKERNKEWENGSLSEKSREPEAEPVKVRAKAKLVI